MQTQIILLLFVVLASVSASNQHLICKSVNDVFSENPNGHENAINNTAKRIGRQGKPGKRGPVGPRGYPGQRGIKGESGYVDYNNISEIVERKVCEGLSAIASGVKTLQEDVNTFQLNVNHRLNCMASGLLYNGTCYSLPYISASEDLSREEAIQTCRDIGAEIAEVNDKTQQIILASFVRPKIPSSLDYLNFWTGMTYHSDRQIIRYRSGRKVSRNQLLWWPGHPLSRRYVIFGVHKSSSDGIFDSNTPNFHAVICERKL